MSKTLTVMQHLEEVSLLLEAVIRQICEVEHREDNFTTGKCSDLGCEEKISTNLNEIYEALRKDDGIFVNNDIENIEKQFSLSDRLDTTGTSSGFGDLSATKYDDNKCSSQETERNSRNETDESKFTLTGENDLKPSENFVAGKNDDNEDIPRILTSTPKREKNENSFRFNSLDNLNENSDENSSLTYLNGNRENGEYLNVTIEEAIEKYEQAYAEVETKFKEVSVQTIIDQLLAVQCRCGLLNSKIGDGEICVTSPEYPPFKKSKMDEDVLKEYESSKVTEDSQEGSKPQPKISCSQSSLDSLSTKDNTTTIGIVKDEEGSICFKKILPRIRIGLSKRAKPPPLHNKFNLLI